MSGSAPTDVDALTLTIVWKRLVDICNEMGTALRRTAYSPATREAEDCAVALFDSQARIIAQAVFTPGQVGSMPFALAHALEQFPPDQLAPGDGIVLNDAYLGNGHLPDVFCFSPIHLGGRLVGYAGACCHHLDVGGAAPGSQATAGISDMYQEGMRILPVLAFVAGEPVPDVMRLITANVRRPRDTAGDLKAKMNACLVGARGLLELYGEYGTVTVETCVRESLARTESAMRAAIASIPPGRYEFTDRLDDWGPGTDALVIQVAVEVRGDELRVDFAGSSSQVRAAINCPYNLTYAYSLFAIVALIAPDIPQNDGCRRPVKVVAPVGSFLNPRPPYPTAGRAPVAVRIVDAIMGAMAEALPGRAVAAPSHYANTTFGGINPATGEPFVYFELLIGGSGARADKDGADGLASCFNTGNIPIEVQEATMPIIVERLEFIKDSAGAGQFRGGVGIRKDIRLLTGPVRLSNSSDRYKYAPWGLAGGGSGVRGSCRLTRGDDTIGLESKVTRDLQAEDLLQYEVSGAGGFGSPLKRDPEAVLDDVVDGLVTRSQAADVYGVVLTKDNDAIDDLATANARRKLRQGSA